MTRSQTWVRKDGIRDHRKCAFVRHRWWWSLERVLLWLGWATWCKKYRINCAWPINHERSCHVCNFCIPTLFVIFFHNKNDLMIYSIIVIFLALCLIVWWEVRTCCPSNGVLKLLAAWQWRQRRHGRFWELRVARHLSQRLAATTV